MYRRINICASVFTWAVVGSNLIWPTSSSSFSRVSGRTGFVNSSPMSNTETEHGTAFKSMSRIQTPPFTPNRPQNSTPCFSKSHRTNDGFKYDEVSRKEVTPDSPSTKSSASSKIILISTLSTLILVVTALAQSNLIPSLYYTNVSDLQRDIVVTLFAAASSTLLINTISYFTSIQTLSSRDSRKLIHTLSAPLFCFLLPLYSSNTLGAQLFASSVVLTQMFKLLLAGFGLGGKDEESLAKAVSRKGDKEEALGGPLIYCIVLLSIILLFWKDETGIMTLSAMAAGDGMADIVGRRYGTTKWSFSPNKSVAGTGAFILSSSLCAIALLFWFHFMGCLPNLMVAPTMSSWLLVFTKVLIISSLSSLVELSTVLDDNITVPLTAAILSFFLF